MRTHVTTLVLLSLSVSAGQPQSSPKVTAAIGQHCAEAWPTDFQMQQYCRQNQQQGFAKTAALTDEIAKRGATEPMQPAITQCIVSWAPGLIRERILPPDGTGIRKRETVMDAEYATKDDDWQMLAYCIETQWKAFKSIRRM